MLFNTFTFGVFLALVFGLYIGLGHRARQVLLLLASYVFYCWVHPEYGLLLLASTVLDYSCGLGLGRVENPRGRRWLLAASIVGNLGMLGFFKYGNFFATNVAGVGRWLGFNAHWKPMEILLPVGISFYTFQTMAYTLQVFRRRCPPERDFLSLALYVAFFPQLVAGPIERADHLLPQLIARRPIRIEDLGAGMNRILVGLFKKLVVADRLAILVDMVFRDLDFFSTVTVWMALPAFAVQVYYDFSGYCDIAIGTARLFGVHLQENFRRPMLATSISDFWDRWHITFAHWLRDFLFFPLGGSRRGIARTVFNIWVVFLLCGLWHGARWTFVIWGAYHAALNAGYHLWHRWRRARAASRGAPDPTKAPPRGLRRAAAIGLTFFCTFVLNTVFFRSPDLATIGRVFGAMIGRSGGAAQPTGSYVWVFGAIIVAAFLADEVGERLSRNPVPLRLPLAVRAAAFAVLVVLTTLLAVSNAHPYVYFQF